MTHWQSPQFHAYYPCNNSYVSTLADILSDALAPAAFTWVGDWGLGIGINISYFADIPT